MTPLVLGVLAVLLAGPAPAVLSRVTRLHLTPAVSMVLWQALAMAAVLAALGAGLSLVTTHALVEGAGFWTLAVALGALALTCVVLVRLGISGHRVGTNLRHLRRQHRRHVDLLAQVDEGHGFRVIDHDVPLAYCLPGRRSRIVLSAGARDRLDAGQLDAVLAHERAHLRARHDLVVEAFTVLHQAFPRFVSSSAALREVQLLAEILADRAAVEAAGERALYEALLTMAEGRTPDGALGAGAADLSARVVAVQRAGRRRVQSVVVLLAAGALLVLPTWLVVAPWLTDWWEAWARSLG